MMHIQWVQERVKDTALWCPYAETQFVTLTIWGAGLHQEVKDPVVQCHVAVLDSLTWRSSRGSNQVAKVLKWPEKVADVYWVCCVLHLQSIMAWSSCPWRQRLLVMSFNSKTVVLLCLFDGCSEYVAGGIVILYWAGFMDYRSCVESCTYFSINLWLLVGRDHFFLVGTSASAVHDIGGCIVGTVI